jgi:hypothetical protein
MTRRYGWMLALVVLGAAVALAAAADKIQTRYSKTEDLAQMKDGETRTFGEGKAQITASRRGDDIEITLPAEDGKTPRTLTCKAGDQHCFVMAHDELGHGTVMVMRAAGDGASNEAFSWSGGDGGTWTDESGKTMVLHSDGGEHEIRIVAEADGEPGTVKVIRVDAGDGEPGEVKVYAMDGDDTEGFKMLSGSSDAPQMIRIEVKGTMLHCPEGDATLHVEEGDDAVYLCPKHNVAMEKGGPLKTFERHIEVHQKAPDQK